MMRTRTIFLLLLVGALVSCGVKGKPLPPLEPIPLSDGTLVSRKIEKKKKSVQLVPREDTPSHAVETGP